MNNKKNIYIYIYWVWGSQTPQAGKIQDANSRRVVRSAQTTKEMQYVKISRTTLPVAISTVNRKKTWRKDGRTSPPPKTIGSISFQNSNFYLQIKHLQRKSGAIPYCKVSTIFSLNMEMSRLTRDGTAEPVSRDQILRRERGQGKNHFPCSVDHELDWQPYPVDSYPCCM